MTRMTKIKEQNQLVVGKPFAATAVQKLVRSRPFEFLEPVKVIVDNLGPGQAIELDSGLVSEHAVRKYLSILAGKDPRYGQFIVRTSPNPGRRRRVFLTYPVNISVAADNGDHGSDEGSRP